MIGWSGAQWVELWWVEEMICLTVEGFGLTDDLGKA